MVRARPSSARARSAAALAALLLVAFGFACRAPDRPWRKLKSGPPQPWEQDVTVVLDSGETATFRVAFGRMEEVEPGVEHIVEYGKREFRLRDRPCFGVEVAPLSGSHLLRCVYRHPPVVDAEGRRRTRTEQPGMKPVGPATDSVTHYNALDFSRVGDNWRVPGEWTMSVYEGRALVTSVTFVLRAD